MDQEAIDYGRISADQRAQHAKKEQDYNFFGKKGYSSQVVNAIFAYATKGKNAENEAQLKAAAIAATVPKS
ncbi:MAG: hypothetical protein IJR22_07415 [Acidaminococcaceae bacterium]|nr:hypothetical protein [Acidaminococcaceae bacterium]